MNSSLKRTPWGQKRKEAYQTERAFQEQVEELAGYLGWWCFHLNQPMRSPAGFPDLVLFRERVIFAELKTRSPRTGRAGKLAPAQVEMAQRCFKAGAEYYSWLFPDSWDELVAVLTERRPSGHKTPAIALSYISGNDGSSLDPSTYSPASKDGPADNE